MRIAIAIILAFLVAAPAASKTVMNLDLLKGSPRALEHQNRQADRQNFSRLNEKTLAGFKKDGLLVRLPSNKTLKVDYRIPSKYRWCRPEVTTFMLNLSSEYYAVWHRPLRINSAVRTEEYQEQLRRHNGNAARATSGPKRSSHLTGATVDIAKKGMSAGELRWMRARLIKLERQGRVEATEEHMQAVFHVMVFQVKSEKKTKKTAPRRPPH